MEILNEAGKVLAGVTLIMVAIIFCVGVCSIGAWLMRGNW